jgi:hypothetical protein
MSQRIADVSAKVARPFYPLPRMTDNNVLSASSGKLTGPFWRVVQNADESDAHRRGAEAEDPVAR